MSGPVEPNAAADKANPHENRYYRVATPIAVLALVVSCGAAGFTWWQAYLARQNNIVSQRAFVHISDFKVDIIRTPDGTYSLRIATPFVNSGNTATKDFAFYIRCAPAVIDAPEPCVMLNPEITKIRQLLAPHQTQPALCSFPMTHIRQTKDGNAHAYVLGDITYRDRLDSSMLHRTQFSFELVDINIIDPPAQVAQTAPNAASAPAATPSTPNAIAPIVFVYFQPRGQHNCADEDCPTQ
jgi:hypothetical protein